MLLSLVLVGTNTLSMMRCQDKTCANSNFRIGWYGLTAARTYLRLAPGTNLTIIESGNSVGGVWSKDRIYPNLVAQVKHGLFNYTDTPMPRDGATKNDMVTGYMIQDYLEKYARDHDLLKLIQFNNWVERAERCPRGWRLRLRGSGKIIETEKLMVATGVTSIPNMPNFDMSAASIPLIHSKDLAVSVNAIGSDDVQSVVVVGAAKSGYDAVYLLLSMGKKVTWMIRPDGAGPMPIMPSEMLGCNSIAVGSTRLMSYLSPSILNSNGPLCSFFQRTLVGRWLTGKFWDLTTYLCDKEANFAKGDHIAALRPECKTKRFVQAARTMYSGLRYTVPFGAIPDSESSPFLISGQPFVGATSRSYEITSMA